MLTTNLLPAIARSCRQLCALSICSDDKKLWEPSEALLSAEAPSDAFTLLHTPVIEHNFAASACALQPTESLLRALSSLFRHAPNRRLCLLSHMDVTHISFYANFPSLARLRLEDGQLKDILHHCCHQRDSSGKLHGRYDGADGVINGWLARMQRKLPLAEADRECEADEEEGEDEEELCRGQEAEDAWLCCPAFVSERVFPGADGRLLTGREAWLQRGQAEAAATRSA